MGNRRDEFVIYTAVLPAYRHACIQELRNRLGPKLVLFCSREHIDPTVRTGIPDHWYVEVRNRRLFHGQAFLQLGGWRTALAARATIVDLNPRSLTAWVLLIGRRVLRRRSLVWGHLEPQAGAGSGTAWLRRMMRQLSQGTVLYGYDSVLPAKEALPSQPVWVAANAIYPAATMRHEKGTLQRRDFLYVGRFEPKKKVSLAIEAFARSKLVEQGFNLILIGGGSDEPALRAQAETLGLTSNVHFPGWVYDADRLRAHYARTICSLSPGYAGLGLTQSIGFGVPVLVALNERHSPEIELVRTGAITFFPSDDASALSEALCAQTSQPTTDRQRIRWSDAIATAYSAEVMSEGLGKALSGQPQQLGRDGWPSD